MRQPISCSLHANSITPHTSDLRKRSPAWLHLWRWPRIDQVDPCKTWHVMICQLIHHDSDSSPDLTWCLTPLGNSLCPSMAMVSLDTSQQIQCLDPTSWLQLSRLKVELLTTHGTRFAPGGTLQWSVSVGDSTRSKAAKRANENSWCAKGPKSQGSLYLNLKTLPQ